jgi:hypothetical protein
VANKGFLTTEMHNVATLGLVVETKIENVLKPDLETLKKLSIWYKLAQF